MSAAESEGGASASPRLRQDQTHREQAAARAVASLTRQLNDAMATARQMGLRVDVEVLCVDSFDDAAPARLIQSVVSRVLEGAEPDLPVLRYW